MKLAKLSLAAIVVTGLASSSFAASNSLEEAFKNGKVNGEIKAYYFANENDKGDKDSIFTTGLLLGYKTDSLYGFSFGATFQGSASPFADNGGKEDYSGSMYGPGAVLSEAYLQYAIAKTTVKVGRQFIDTPLVSGSGGRVVKEAFEGVTVVNTDLPNTTLIAGYVQKFQARTAGTDYEAPKFTKNFSTNSGPNVDIDNGAYTVAAINKSVPGLTLTAAYAYADEYYKTSATAKPANFVAVDGGVHVAYAEALYEGKAGEVGYTLGAQDYYNKINDSKTSDNSINAFGLKAGASFKGLNGYVAYAQVSSDDVAAKALISGLGNGADLLYTSPVINAAFYGADSKSYAVDLNYDITAAANVGARYVEVKDDLNSKNKAYTSAYAYYKFDSMIKGFKMGVEFEDQSKDVDGKDLWVKANYKF